MADLLLACLDCPVSGSSDRGRVQLWLQDLLGEAPHPVVADGSGLSVANRISASQAVGMLRWAHPRVRVFADLLASPGQTP